jgi:hypothetical protein
MNKSEAKQYLGASAIIGVGILATIVLVVLDTVQDVMRNISEGQKL